RRDDDHARRCAFISVKWNPNHLHSIPLRGRNVVANDIVLVICADAPLGTRISQCYLTCFAPAMVSLPQVQRHSQYRENSYRDDRGRTIISRRQILNPYRSEYKDGNERGYHVARHEHRNNEVRSSQQSNRRQPDPEDQQHCQISTRTPELKSAHDREQREQQERPTTQPALECRQWLP